MKNFFNVTHKNSSKAVAIFFALMIIAALAVSFFGCGSDNPVNNGNPNPPASGDSLLFSLDSFNLSGSGNLQIDTIFNFADSTYDSLKITFTVSSNCDTLDNAWLNVSFGDAGLSFFYRDLNASYTLYATKNNVFWFALYSRFNTSTQRYIRAYNFKLYLR